MLVYANSLELLKLGEVVTIDENSVLYTEYTDADIYAELESTIDQNIITYRIIIDEQIHDPLIYEQTKHVYKPDSEGLYKLKKKRYTQKKFYEFLSNTVFNKGVFNCDHIKDCIFNFGFAGVYYFENKSQRILTVKEITGSIIGAYRDGKNLKLEL